MSTMCSYEEGRGRSIHLSAAKPALSRRREERKRDGSLPETTRMCAEERE